MEKEKSKRKRLWWLKPAFDYVSPFPLSECVFLLQGQSGQVTGRWPYAVIGAFLDVELVVDINMLDADTYAFRLRWQDKRQPFKLPWPFPIGEAQGILKRWDNTSTHIVGQASVSAFNLLVHLVMLLLFAGFYITLMTSSAQLSVACLLLIPIGGLVLNIVALADARLQLVKVLRGTLRPDLENLRFKAARKHG